MGMRLVSNVEVGLRSFTQICERLGLPVPVVRDEEYCAVITEQAYRAYSREAVRIAEKVRFNNSINCAEFEFSRMWTVISSARLDWLVENDPNQNNDWGDIYFQ